MKKKWTRMIKSRRIDTNALSAIIGFQLKVTCRPIFYLFMPKRIINMNVQYVLLHFLEKVNYKGMLCMSIMQTLQ